MKYCRKCGAELADTAQFCPKCGTPMAETMGNQNPVPPMYGTNPNMPGTNSPKKSSGGKAVIIILIALIAAAAMIIVALLLVGKKNKTEAVTEAETVQETTVATTAAETTPAATTPAETAPAVINWNMYYSSAYSLDRTNRIPVSWDMVGQSSYIYQEGYNNSGEMAFDGDETTSWQVNTGNTGIGDYLTVDFKKKQPVSEMALKLGNHRSDELYLNNNVPKTLSIYFDNYSFENITFPQERTEFVLVFDYPVETSTVRIVINDIYPGRKYTDTVVADILFYGKFQKTAAGEKTLYYDILAANGLHLSDDVQSTGPNGNLQYSATVFDGGSLAFELYPYTLKDAGDYYEVEAMIHHSTFVSDMDGGETKDDYPIGTYTLKISKDVLVKGTDYYGLTMEGKTVKSAEELANYISMMDPYFGGWGYKNLYFDENGVVTVIHAQTAG